jgi:hypothetical protein
MELAIAGLPACRPHLLPINGHILAQHNNQQTTADRKYRIQNRRMDLNDK